MTISGSLLGTALLSLYDNNGAPSEDIPGNSGPSASVVYTPRACFRSDYPTGLFACSDVIGGKAYFACRTLEKYAGSTRAWLHLFESDGTDATRTSILIADILAQGVAAGCTQDPLLFAPVCFYKGKLLLATVTMTTLPKQPPNWQRALAVFDPVSKTVEKIAPSPQPKVVRATVAGTERDYWGYEPAGTFGNGLPSVNSFAFDKGTGKLVTNLPRGRFDANASADRPYFNRYGASSTAYAPAGSTLDDEGRAVGFQADLDLTSFTLSGTRGTFGPLTMLGVLYNRYDSTGFGARASTFNDFYAVSLRNKFGDISAGKLTNDIDTDPALFWKTSYTPTLSEADDDTYFHGGDASSPNGFTLANPAGEVFDFVLACDRSSTTSTLATDLKTASFRAIRKTTPGGQVTRFSMNPATATGQTYAKFPVEIKSVIPGSYAPRAGATAYAQMNSGGSVAFALSDSAEILLLDSANVPVKVRVPARIAAGEWFVNPALAWSAYATEPVEKRNAVHAVQVMNGKLLVLHANLGRTIGYTGTGEAWTFTSVHFDVLDDPRF